MSSLVRALWFLYLTLVPVVAKADPTIWTAIGAFFVEHAIAIALITYTAVESANARRKARAERSRRIAEYNANLQDRTAQILDANPPWRVIYGQATVSGFIAANFTTDKVGVRDDGTPYTKPDGYRHLVIVFASHECTQYNEIFINGKAVGALDGNGSPTSGPYYRKGKEVTRVGTIPPSGVLVVPEGVVKLLFGYLYTNSGGSFIGGGNGTSTVTSATLANNNTEIHGSPGALVHYTVYDSLPIVRIQKHLGVPYEAVDTFLYGLKPQQWDATHTVSGHTYIVLSLDLEEQQFQGGPPAVTADLLGRKLYDNRSQLFANPYMIGSATGTPGTSPTNMTWTAVGNSSGLSRTILGSGEQFGIPYVDVRISGVSQGVGEIRLYFAQVGSAPAAAINQSIYFAAYVSKIAGSTANFTTIALTVHEFSNTTELATSSLPISLPASPSSVLSDNIYKTSRVLTQGGTNQVNGSLRLTYNGGQALDITLRIGLPMLAQNAHVIGYSANPALATSDFLLSEYGYAVTRAEINDASLIQAANDCAVATTFEYRNEAGSIVSTFSGPRYTCNGAFTTDDSKENVFEDIKAAMAGTALPSGQWFINAGAWHPPVLALTDDHLMGVIEIVQVGEPIAEVANGLRGNYFPAPIYGTGAGYKTNGALTGGATSIPVNLGTGTLPTGGSLMFANDDTIYTIKAGISAPGTLTLAYPGLSKATPTGTAVYVVAAGGQTPAEFEPYQNATYLSADGKPLWANVSFPYTNDKARCRNLARIKLESKRSGMVISYPAQMIAWPLQPGDRVSVTSAEYGFNAKTFRVTDWGWGLESAVMLTLQEDTSQIYDLADATVIDSTPNTDLPDPYVVAPLTNFAANSGTDYLLRLKDGTLQPRIWVSWDPSTSPYVVGGQGRIVLQHHGPGTNEFMTQNVDPDTLGVWVTGYKETDMVLLRAYVENSLGNRSAASFAGVQVIGESQNPANVAWLTATPIAGGVILAWLPNTEADYAATEIHQEAVWNDTTAPVFKGPANTYTLMGLPVGSYTFMAKHVDTTGHKSTTAISVSVIVNTDANSSNLIDSTWWRPGASIIWNQNTDDGGDVNDFVWQVGPKGNIEALWRATAGSNGQAGGGWIQNFGSSPVLDRTKTYRFAVPVKKLSGDGSAYWGVYPSEVCNLNTSTTNGNPYFVYSALPIGKWYLMVGFVFPVGQTGLTNQGAGVYDMTTGVLYASGANWNFANNPANSVPSRALQYYSSAGSQMLFGHPMCHLVDGSEPSMTELLQSSAILNSQQQWTDVQNRPKTYRVVTYGASTPEGAVGHIAGVFDAETDATVSLRDPTYTVASFSRSTKALLSTQSFNVSSSVANATAMASLLNSFGNDRIVAVYTWGDSQTNRLAGGLEAAMYRCGASRVVYGSSQFKWAAAYALIGIPGSGEGNGAEFYQGTVDSDTLAWVDVTFTIQNGTLIGVSPSYTPRSLRDYGYVGSLNASEIISLLHNSNSGHVVNGGAFTRATGGAFAANDSVYSSQRYSGGVSCSFVPTLGGSAYFVAGLASNPNRPDITDALEHMVIMRASTSIEIREGGTEVHGGTYTGGPISIAYDGYYIRYYTGGVLMKTTAVGAGFAFSFMAASVDTGGLSQISLLPMSPVVNIDTPQLGDNSVTTPKITDFSATIPVTSLSSGDANNSATIAIDTDCAIVIGISLAIDSAPTVIAGSVLPLPASVKWELYRNGVLIFTSLPLFGNAQPAFLKIDKPGIGSHTYMLRTIKTANVGGVYNAITSRGIVLLAAKK